MASWLTLGLWSEALLLVLYSRLLVSTFALPSLPLSLSTPSPPLVVQSVLLVEFSRLYYCISLLWALPDASGCILLSTYLGAGLSSLSTSGAETSPTFTHSPYLLHPYSFICFCLCACLLSRSGKDQGSSWLALASESSQHQTLSVSPGKFSRPSCLPSGARGCAECRAGCKINAP